MSVLIKEVMPLADKGSVDAITAVVNTVLKQPGIVRLVIDARQDNLEFWRGVSEDEASEKSISQHDMLRQVDMEEYDQYLEDGDPPKSSYHQMFEIFEMVEDAGCSPNYILTGGSMADIRKWIPISRKTKTMFGIPVIFEGTLEDDVLIVCGSRTKEATSADIEYAVKVTML